MAPIYRQLNRSRNEIRLLKVLLPESTSATAQGSLDFSSDIIRCDLQYESLDDIHLRTSGRDYSQNSILDYIFQDIPRMRNENDPGTDTRALMNSLKRDFSNL
jgi:hypothetical protein